MTIWTNTGRGNIDGDMVTAARSGAAGDNPFAVLVGGWRYEADNLSPDGPSDGLGYRATVTESGTTAYLRGDDPEPTSNRGGARFWLRIPEGAPSTDVEILRILDSAGAAVGSIQCRTTGVVRVTNVFTGVAASQTTTPAPGWYCFELIFDPDNGAIDFRIQDAAGGTVHEWSGTGQTIARIPHTYRPGRQGGNSPGAAWDEIDIGSMLRWGSLSTGWIGPGEPVDPDPVDPPAPTSRVTHWNSAEGRPLDEGPRLGGVDAVDTDGMGVDAIHGSGGQIRAASDIVAHGTRSYRLNAPPNTSAYFEWTTSTREVAARMYLYLPGAPGATQRILDVRAPDGSRPGTIFLSPDGRIGLQGAGGSGELPGVPLLPAWLRLEMTVNLDTGELWGGWAHGDGGLEGQLTYTGGFAADLLSAVHFGKTHGTAWDATGARMDDLALNTVVATPISVYAPTYEIQATAAPALLDLEPGVTFVLVGYGNETWHQVVRPGHPVVPVTQTGSTAAGTTPTTLHGVTLEYDFGGATQSVEVMRATKRIKTAEGWAPVATHRTP